MIGLGRHHQGLWITGRKPLLAAAPLVQVQLTVKAMYPLVIPVVAPAPQDLEELTESIGRIALNGFLQLGYNLLIPAAVRPVTVH